MIRLIFLLWLALSPLCFASSVGGGGGPVNISDLIEGGTCTDDHFIRWDDSGGVFQCEAAPGAAGGDAWGDAVDDDILPDTDSTRDIGATANRFAEGWFDALESTAITEGGTALSTKYVLAQSTTDNAMCRYDGTSGQVQDSGITVDDSNNVSGMGTLASGVHTISGGAALSNVSGDLGLNNGLRLNGNSAQLTVTGSRVFSSIGYSAAVFASTTTNAANSGISRYANTDTVCWRNAGNSANVCMSVNSSNDFDFVGNVEVNGQVWSPLDSESGSGTSHTIDWDDGNSTVLDLGNFTGGGAVTLTLSNPQPGGVYVIKSIQETDSGARTITWPSSAPDTLWPGGTPCTLSTGDEDVDLITLLYDGTNYLASCNNDYQ